MPLFRKYDPNHEAEENCKLLENNYGGTWKHVKEDCYERKACKLHCEAVAYVKTEEYEKPPKQLPNSAVISTFFVLLSVVLVTMYNQL